MQALYQIEMTGDLSPRALDLFWDHFEAGAEAREFARELVYGVLANKERIDQAIEASAENWKLGRMAKVDLTVLRVATYELLMRADIPVNVSIDEAIEVGKRFGSEDSSPFINGVLDRVAVSAGPKQKE